MKSIALAFALVSTLVTLPMIASARSVDRTPVVASVSGDLAGIESVYLLADGRLQIKPQTGNVQTVVLSKIAKDQVIELAASVADVELNEQISAAVCMMVPPPSLSRLSVSGYDITTHTFNSVRKLTLTNADCTVAHQVSPKNPFVERRAVELRAALVALSLNAFVTAEEKN